MGVYIPDITVRSLKKAPFEDVRALLAEGEMYDAELPHWIPCSKRLPHKEKKGYWVCTNSGYQCQCRWTNVNHFWTDLTTDWHWHIMDIPQHTEVVAWMTLPTAYKEGAEECLSK